VRRRAEHFEPAGFDEPPVGAKPRDLSCGAGRRPGHQRDGVSREFRGIACLGLQRPREPHGDAFPTRAKQLAREQQRPQCGMQPPGSVEAS
jgi:hypothetical protein